MKIALVALFLYMLLLTCNVFAEPYKSKDLPPDKIITETIIKADKPSGWIFKGILGNRMISDAEYFIYYMRDGGHGLELNGLHFIRLDSGIWLWEKSPSPGLKVLEKR
jgi:hypothetical protein